MQQATDLLLVRISTLGQYEENRLIADFILQSPFALIAFALIAFTLLAFLASFPAAVHASSFSKPLYSSGNLAAAAITDMRGHVASCIFCTR